MRRAVGVYERIIRRFTAQDTDYQLLLSTFAEGLYTEMDFRNEALNMERMTMLMDESEFGSRDVVIPKPFMERTTRSVSFQKAFLEGNQVMCICAHASNSFETVQPALFHECFLDDRRLPICKSTTSPCVQQHVAHECSDSIGHRSH